MQIRHVAYSILITMTLVGCGDDVEPKTNAGQPDGGLVDDAGADAGTDDGGTDAGTECAPSEIPFEGECLTRAFSIQATVDEDVVTITSSPFATTEGTVAGEAINESCSITTSDDEPGDLAECYDGGALTVSNGRTGDSLELGQADDCYSAEAQDFGMAGDTFTAEFAGGAEIGPVSLDTILVEPPAVEVTENGDGSVSFVASNPIEDGSFFITFLPETSTGTNVSCFVADGTTLELSAEDAAAIVSTLGERPVGLASYARSSESGSNGTYVTLASFAFDVVSYNF